MSKCLGCGTASEPLKADHCHKRGHQRGPLCHRCNIYMAWIDRGMAPNVQPPFTVASLARHAGRCPECTVPEAGSLGPARSLSGINPGIGFDQRIRINDRLADELKAYADHYKISVSATIRVLLHKGLDAENGSKN